MACRFSSCSLMMCITCSRKLGTLRDIVTCRCWWTRARIAYFSHEIRAANWDGCLRASCSLWTDNGHVLLFLIFVFPLFFACSSFFFFPHTCICATSMILIFLFTPLSLPSSANVVDTDPIFHIEVARVARSFCSFLYINLLDQYACLGTMKLAKS